MSIEEDEYGIIEVEKKTQPIDIGRRKYLKTPMIICERTMYFVKLSKDGKTAISKYDAELRFRKTENGDWRCNR